MVKRAINKDENMIQGEAIANTNNAVAVVKYFSDTEAGLVKLREEKGSLVFDYKTPEGMAAARKTRGELVTMRTTLERLRKEKTAPHLEAQRAIKAEADRITEEILKLESPIDKEINLIEKEEARIKAVKAEEKRLAIVAIVAKIDNLKNLPLQERKADAKRLEEVLDVVIKTQITEAEYLEYFDDAVYQLNKVIAELQDMLDQRLTEEAAAESLRLQQEELAKQQALLAAQQEDERIARERTRQIEDSIQSIYKASSGLTGMGSEAISLAYSNLLVMEITKEVFGDYVESASEAKMDSLEIIGAALEAQQGLEAQQTELKRQQKELEDRQAEDARIRKIEGMIRAMRNIPAEHVNSTSSAIGVAIYELRDRLPSLPIYGEFLDRAVTAHNEAIDDLKGLFDIKRKSEEAALAAAAEEADRIRKSVDVDVIPSAIFPPDAVNLMQTAAVRVAHPAMVSFSEANKSKEETALQKLNDIRAHVSGFADQKAHFDNPAFDTKSPFYEDMKSAYEGGLNDGAISLARAILEAIGEQSCTVEK